MGHSIGEVAAAPLPASAARLRATLPGRFGADALDELAADLRRWSHSLGDDGPSRVSVRAVLGDDAHDLADRLPGLEALAPLASGDAVAWLGACTPERALDRLESARLDEVAARAARNHGPGGGPNLPKIRARIDAARERGYEVLVAADEHARAVLADEHGKEITALLERFGYDNSASLEVLAEPSSLVATARFEDRVVAVVVLERLAVPIGDERPTLVLAELTDSSVDDSHVGSGLQLVLHAHLLASLVARDELPDLVFSESGYTASLFNAANLGRAFRGRLPNHAQIGVLDSRPGPSGQYQSLEVTTTGPSEVRSLIDELRQSGTI